MSAEKVLTIEELSKNDGKIHALDNLNLTISKGNVYGLLGPNGSGKTTTLSIIMGIVISNSGTYKWLDYENNNDAKKRIGALIETPLFYPYLSLEKNLEISALIKNIDKSDISRVLKIVGLEKRKTSRFDTLSLGMKQRLALASVLLGDPDILVLDEPTNGLDPEGIAEVRTIIRNEASKGKTIILASHILDEVEKVCSHVAVLKSGKLIATGKVNELLNTEETFIISTDRISDFYDTLKTSDLSKNENIKGFDIHFNLITGRNISEINQFAFSKGFVLNKIEKNKNTLEKQFLEIIK